MGRYDNGNWILDNDMTRMENLDFSKEVIINFWNKLIEMDKTVD